MDSFEKHENLRQSLKELKALPKVEYDNQDMIVENARTTHGQNEQALVETVPEKRRAGRYRMHAEDKAKPNGKREHAASGLNSPPLKSEVFENVNTKRTSGRYRMNDEDKAKPKTFRLSNSDLELLSFAPGKNDTEKLRYLIQNQYRFQLKMNRYSKRLKKAIAQAYSDLRACVSREIHNDDSVKKTKLLSNFQDSYNELTAIIEFFEFDGEDFKQLLEDQDNRKLSAVLMGRESLW